MVRYLTLLSFLLFGYFGSLHARYLHQQEFLNILGRIHHVKSRSTSCPPNLCLSQYNYCGTDETYCGEGCKGGPCYGDSSSGDDNPRSPSSGNDYSGDATYYDPGLGACGIYSNGDELVCAVADSVFELADPNGNPNNNPLCGRYISVTGPKGTVKVKVVDRCGSCKSGDLDLSRPAFNQIGDPEQGRVHIDWHYL